MLVVKDTSCLADYGFKQSDLQAGYNIWQYDCGCDISIIVNHVDPQTAIASNDNVLHIYNDTGNDNLVPLPEVIMEMIQSGDIYVKTRSKERY